jgi:hypothetical protein
VRATHGGGAKDDRGPDGGQEAGRESQAIWPAARSNSRGSSMAKRPGFPCMAPEDRDGGGRGEERKCPCRLGSTPALLAGAGSKISDIDGDDVDTGLSGRMAAAGVPGAGAQAHVFDLREVEAAPFAARRQARAALASKLVGESHLLTGSVAEDVRAEFAVVALSIHFGNTFGWRARLDGYMMGFSKKSPFGLPLPVRAAPTAWHTHCSERDDAKPGARIRRNLSRWSPGSPVRAAPPVFISCSRRSDPTVWSSLG